MTKDEVRAELDDAIKMTTGRSGPFADETRIAAICMDSLETIELMIALEIKFERSFDHMEESEVHSGTYGELLFKLGSIVGTHAGNYGDLDWPAANHYDPGKRGFQPK